MSQEKTEPATCDCDDCRFVTRTKWYVWVGVLALVTVVGWFGRRRR